MQRIGRGQRRAHRLPAVGLRLLAERGGLGVQGARLDPRGGLRRVEVGDPADPLRTAGGQRLQPRAAGRRRPGRRAQQRRELGMLQPGEGLGRPRPPPAVRRPHLRPPS
jgi:hypothetical protein